MAKTSSEWENLLNNLGDKPTYTSKYQSTIDSLLDKITNRESFSYDFNADPLYQQYKDSYVKLGNEASMNAAANASALSGGYGNSYAATAATQANQQYLTQLNNVIPELANAALNKYQMETENLYNQYSVYGDAEDRNYSQYRDTVSDYYNDRDYYTSGYNNALNYEYQQKRDEVADSQWQQTFEYNKANADRNYNYQVSRDQVSDDQWNQTFKYQQDRDAVSDYQWEKNYNLSAQNAANSAANTAASLAWQKEKYYNDLKLQKEQQAKEDAQNYGTASDSDYAKYKNFATQHGMTEDQVREYLNNLYDNYKIDPTQLKSLARAAGIRVN